MLKICFIELKDDIRESGGSLGAMSICHAVKQMGYEVDLLEGTKDGYDVELISVHFYTSYEHVKRMPKRAKIRILGGNPLKDNPLPLIPFCDAICVGEGETWIKEALRIIDETRDAKNLATLSGTIVSELWKHGNLLPNPNIECEIPDNPAFLSGNRDRNLKNEAWTIELSRGCPYKCDFCALSSHSKYRLNSTENIKYAIDGIDLSKCKSINFVSAENGSHPGFNEIMQYIKSKGLRYTWGSSLRLEQYLRNELTVLSTSKLRFGIDGLSEETRFKVKKNITDQMILELFRRVIENGHVNLKLYMIIGYPWETEDVFARDFGKWTMLFEAIKQMEFKKNVILEINWTPLLPIKGTQLEGATVTYNYQMYEAIAKWHAINRHPRNGKGLHIKEIPPSVPWAYNKLVKIATGDEMLFLKSNKRGSIE